MAVPASAARLPITAPHDWWPLYSPNSRLVAYTEIAGRIDKLEIADPAHPSATRRIAQSSYQLLPSWSPDSTHVAYQEGGRIWTIRVDGTERKEIGAGLYPAWSPDGTTVAFVQAGVVHAGAGRYGQDVIGIPAWSHDGKELVFTQSDGIYVADVATGSISKLAAPGPEVRTVSWSPDDQTLAYAAGRWVYTLAANGRSQPQIVAGPFDDIGPVIWANTPDLIAYNVRGAVETTSFDGPVHSQRLARTNGVGVTFAPGDPHSDVVLYSGPNPRCTGHDAIVQYQGGVVAGACTIAGTPGADTIVGTANGGDVISAGAGNDTIHARNGRRDTVDCGPGRDTVYADKADRLRGCEIVRR